MSAILRITFLEPAEVDDTLVFKYYWQFPDTSFPANVIQTFVDNRAIGGQCVIGANAVEQAQNYVEAFTMDYTGSGQLVISRDVNIVTIICLNGSEIFDEAINVGGTFAEFESVSASSNNIIHVINLTPRQYTAPALTARNYLITENDLLILTENGKKIRL